MTFLGNGPAPPPHPAPSTPAVLHPLLTEILNMLLLCSVMPIFMHWIYVKCYPNVSSWVDHVCQMNVKMKKRSECRMYSANFVAAL